MRFKEFQWWLLLLALLRLDLYIWPPVRISQVFIWRVYLSLSSHPKNLSIYNLNFLLTTIPLYHDLSSSNKHEMMTLVISLSFHIHDHLYDSYCRQFCPVASSLNILKNNSSHWFQNRYKILLVLAVLKISR